MNNHFHASKKLAVVNLLVVFVTNKVQFKTKIIDNDVVSYPAHDLPLLSKKVIVLK